MEDHLALLCHCRLERFRLLCPRQKRYDEHVNNHQVEFSTCSEAEIWKYYCCRRILKTWRKQFCIMIEIVGTMNAEIDNNNLKFNQKLEEIVNGIFK